mmetsp:Transcript_5808/g.22036  ORF Transcript_5808/g.22036 Transcript_5808/m.22036 type:complete len:345 (+) Transcript_5808:3492-4526(+)
MYYSLVWAQHDLLNMHLPNPRNWFTQGYSHSRRPGPVVKQLNHCYEFRDDDWVPVGIPLKTDTTETPESLRIATLNVLHNHNWHEWFLRSNERYAHTEKSIQRLSPDILALQEVTATMLAVLMRSTFVQQNYFLSDIVRGTDWMDCSNKIPYYAQTQNTLTGNVILSRYPMSAMYMLDTSATHPVSGIVQLGKDRELLVVGFHPKAMDFCHSDRVTETRNTMHAINSHPRMGSIRDCIVLGDFNVHSPNEDANLFEPNMLVDLWHERSDKKENGFTFDAEKNSFVSRYIPFEKRRMRLDRITKVEGSQLSVKHEVTIWADEPVQKGDWLFSSDHFGLWTEMKLE